MHRVACLAFLLLAPSAAWAQRPSGTIERPQALSGFFESLSRLEQGKAQAVRVLQLGDSHTAADHQSAAARRVLQARFGDAGRGTVLFSPPAPYLAEGVRSGLSGEWKVAQARRAPGERGDGRFGLGGLALASGGAGARAWLEAAPPSARVELAYLRQPGGGSFEVFVDGVRQVRLSSRARAPASAWQPIPLAKPARAVEVRVLGDGEVRVFAATFEQGGPGLVYEALGINGARASGILEWNEAHLAEQVAHRAPDLVVLAYGTNEAGERAGAETWERQLTAVLQRVSKPSPSAACLVLGPPDRAALGSKGWASMPALQQVVAAQRRAAEAAGCAYFSQWDAMGGEGSMAAWAQESPPRAARDRVHLTREGYAQLGEAFANALVDAYDAWREEAAKEQAAAEKSAQGPHPAAASAGP
ncbi:MAG: GDSL-type esterase/lipase family protein [Myxococcales bacterium]